MDILVHHGAVIEQLTNQVKKMRKALASKNSVDSFRVEVTRIVEACDFPFDMLLDPAQPHWDLPSHEDRTAQTEEPYLASKTTEVVHYMFSSYAALVQDDNLIQLVELTSIDVSSDIVMTEDT